MGGCREHKDAEQEMESFIFELRDGGPATEAGEDVEAFIPSENIQRTPPTEDFGKQLCYSALPPRTI